MNAGIVGCGLMGRQRARSLASAPGAVLRSVYDPDRPRAAALSAEYGALVATSLDDLLGDDNIEMVIVATPHWTAKQIAVAALRAGKHVLCEKPLGMCLREADEILEAAASAGTQLTPGFNYRFYPGFQHARRIVEAGQIGRVTHLRCGLGHGARPGYEREWKTSKARCGGGALLDPGIHLIDLVRFLLGEVCAGAACLFRSFWDIDVEDNAFLSLETDTGRYAQLHVSITEWKSRCALDIFGTEGSVSVRGRSGFYGPQVVEIKKRWDWLSGELAEPPTEYPVEDRSFAAELSAFIDRIEGRPRPDLACGEDGWRALAVVERAYATAGGGFRSFDLPARSRRCGVSV